MATPFPATHSIPSPGALAEEVLPHYAIGGLLQCRLHMSGVNDIYRVRTETGHYMLKVYRAGWRSAPAVLYELDLLAHLHRGGVPVSLPVARRDGGWITPTRRSFCKGRLRRRVPSWRTARRTGGIFWI